MWHFIPAFVDPNTEGVLEVLDDADGVLKTVNPTSSFDGYQRADQKAVYNQAQAIFN